MEATMSYNFPTQLTRPCLCTGSEERSLPSAPCNKRWFRSPAQRLHFPKEKKRRKGAVNSLSAEMCWWVEAVLFQPQRAVTSKERRELARSAPILQLESSAWPAAKSPTVSFKSASTRTCTPLRVKLLSSTDSSIAMQGRYNVGSLFSDGFLEHLGHVITDSPTARKALGGDSARHIGHQENTRPTGNARERRGK